MKAASAIVGLVVIAVGCRREPDPASSSTSREASARAAEIASGEEPVFLSVPDAEFDPRDRERTFRSIGDATAALQAAHRAKTKANTNGSRDRYAKKLRGFEACIQSFAGQTVTWNVTVKEVQEKGVEIDGTSRFATNSSLPGAMDLAPIQVLTRIWHATPRGKDFETFDEILWFDKQIERALAKDAKPGDVIVIKAHIRETHVLAIEDAPPHAVLFTLDGVRAQSLQELSNEATSEQTARPSH